MLSVLRKVIARFASVDPTCEITAYEHLRRPWGRSASHGHVVEATLSRSRAGRGRPRSYSRGPIQESNFREYPFYDTSVNNEAGGY
jgi:hypothetical protein